MRGESCKDFSGMHAGIVGVIKIGRGGVWNTAVQGADCCQLQFLVLHQLGFMVCFSCHMNQHKLQSTQVPTQTTGNVCQGQSKHQARAEGCRRRRRGSPAQSAESTLPMTGVHGTLLSLLDTCCRLCQQPHFSCLFKRHQCSPGGGCCSH